LVGMRFRFSLVVIPVLMVFALGSVYASDPAVSLPSGTVNAFYDHPGTSSYWDITLSGVGSGHDVSDGTYPGWCADELISISEGSHGVKLLSSYNLGGTRFGVDPDWPSVNWLLNNKGSMTKSEVQDEIWDLLNGGTGSHNGFVPVAGQIYAVVLDADTDCIQQQGTFIEVTVLPAIPLALGAALGLGMPMVFVLRRMRA